MTTQRLQGFLVTLVIKIILEIIKIIKDKIVSRIMPENIISVIFMIEAIRSFFMNFFYEIFLLFRELKVTCHSTQQLSITTNFL